MQIRSCKVSNFASVIPFPSKSDLVQSALWTRPPRAEELRGVINPHNSLLADVSVSWV